MTTGACRFCKTPLAESFCDLGMSPLSNAFVRRERLTAAEKFYPLHAYVCRECLLVQLEAFESPEHIFSDYAYFSSYSESWLAHARAYVEMATKRFGLGSGSFVVEIASNDGYLLRNFVAKEIPVLGVEPAANVAKVAEERGVPTLTRFFGRSLAAELAAEGRAADLLIGNNVLAHVPDIEDFVSGLRVALKPGGTVTLEFPHLLRLMAEVQFDTIYHEHFSYLSLLAVERIFAAHGLAAVDVEELPTHGGSLRLYARRASDGAAPSDSVLRIRRAEDAFGLGDLAVYRRFSAAAQACKRRLLRFLIDAKEAGKRVVGYGAPAKGNTLLNYCGVRTDLLAFTVDRSPHKQGLFLPGTHVPIGAPEKIAEERPDYVLILPWNLREEIMDQLAYVRGWGCKFVTPLPDVRVWD